MENHGSVAHLPASSSSSSSSSIVPQSGPSTSSAPAVAKSAPASRGPTQLGAGFGIPPLSPVHPPRPAAIASPAVTVYAPEYRDGPFTSPPPAVAKSAPTSRDATQLGTGFGIPPPSVHRPLPPPVPSSIVHCPAAAASATVTVSAQEYRSGPSVHRPRHRPSPVSSSIFPYRKPPFSSVHCPAAAASSSSSVVLYPPAYRAGPSTSTAPVVVKSALPSRGPTQLGPQAGKDDSQYKIQYDLERMSLKLPNCQKCGQHER